MKITNNLNNQITASKHINSLDTFFMVDQAVPKTKVKSFARKLKKLKKLSSKSLATLTGAQFLQYRGQGL